MPVVPPSYVQIAGQVTQTTQSPTTQMNLRQMIGSVLQWNPDCPPPLVSQFITNSYRRILDSRLWYGLMTRGQISVPTVYSTGTATFTLGSNLIQGIGTAWTTSMVGMQIRCGFNTGYYNVSAVNPTLQQITVDLPWGNPTASAGYQLLQTWVTLGPNIKLVLEMVNQRQGWRLLCNLPQAALNEWDTWRTTTGWTQILANKEPNAAGWPMYELWPAPTFQQTFPFLAYVQPQEHGQRWGLPGYICSFRHHHPSGDQRCVALPRTKGALLRSDYRPTEREGVYHGDRENEDERRRKLPQGLAVRRYPFSNVAIRSKLSSKSRGCPLVACLRGVKRPVLRKKCSSS